MLLYVGYNIASTKHSMFFLGTPVSINALLYQLMSISTRENFRQNENFVNCDFPTQILRRKNILKLKIFNF